MKSLVSTLLQRSTLMVTSFILAISSLSAAMPLFLSQNANAVGETVVTPTSLKGWQEYTQSGGDVSFVASSDAPLGSGALQLNTADDNNSVASVYVSTDVPLSGINNLSYSTKQLVGPVGSANPSYYLGIDADGSGTNDFYVLYETYWNGANIANQWQTWTINNNTGKFWSTKPVGTLGSNQGGSNDKNFTLNDLKTAYPNAKVFEYGLNMGTYNPDWKSLVDDLSFNSITYDFEPDAAPIVCTYDFSAYKMWEVTWGYDFDHRNGGTPVFNMQSNGGLVSLNGAALPSYMTASWHWIYPTEGNEMHYVYGFADGTTRTVDVVPVEVNGCLIPNIVWGVGPHTPEPQFPSNGAIINYNDFWFDWKNVTGADHYEIQASQSNSTDGNGSLNSGVWAGDYQNIQPTDSKAHSVGATGTWYWQVRAVDGAGNTSAWTAPWKVTIDKTAPTGTATYTGGNRVGNIIYLKTINDLQYDLSLTDNIQLEHTSYAVWKADSNFNNRTLFCGNWNNAITSESISGTSANPSGHVKDCSPLGNWSDGSYVIMHVVYDAAGNLTYFGDTYPGQKFVIDSHKPSVTATMSDTTINSTDPNPTVTVTATDTTSGIDYMQYVIMDASANNVTSWFTLSSPTEVVDLSGLPLDGAYTLRARAFDNAGNKKSGADVAFTIDRTLPVAAITTTGTQSTATPTINGTVGADAVSLVFTIDDVVQPITWTSGSTIWTSTPTSDLSEGSHSMKIVATDPAGNEGGQTGTITISVPAPLITPLATTTGGGTGTPTPTPEATVTPGEVLGDQTTNEDAAKADDSKTNPSASILGDATSNPMNLFGLAWYWWLAILAAIIAAWWIIAAALRRRDNQNV
ncbi:MAG TPA: Ig-like domain-containing protein [Candidatus Saccharibacteria bacterium]|nr:Ig-like domain-containing protein [Candidatus Saccharibacteria bacterium]